ncbi:MAG TPA: hypothetical protein VJ797_15655 [Burkholderiales bacterium]|nr:hypothetical protein [Burkholderiales bacterium]
MEANAKRLLIVIRFGDETPVKVRAPKAAPAILAVIQRCSGGEHQLAFTSRDGSVFGYLLKTTRPLGALRAELYGETGAGTAALLNEDHFFAVELGADFDGRGFSRAWTWLQHH